MATLFNDIFYVIRNRCISDEAASIAAAEVAELVVKKFTSTNNARDEIAALANELEDFNTNRIAPYGRITEIVAKMRQLSPIA